MTNDIFVDSSILVEFIKGTKSKIFENLVNTPSTELFINETVVSEFLYYFLLLNGNASPRSMQSSKRISNVFNNSSDFDLLQRFSFLSNNDVLFTLVPNYMSTYNLLPNDAIILATCKIHHITQLASHDSDFIFSCKQEGIELLWEK